MVYDDNDDDDDDDDDDDGDDGNQYVTMKIWQCCGIKGYIQTEKLQKIDQI
jgi:hypothetical protein